MPTDVLTLDELRARIDQLEAQFDEEDDEPAVLIGAVTDSFTVTAAGDGSNPENPQIGDASFGADAFANAHSTTVLNHAKLALFHTVVLPREYLAEEAREHLADQEGSA